MKKIGILGGGQLGRMLLQAAADYPAEMYVMENSDDCPSAHLCHHFVKGDIKNYDHVMAFGKNLDIITIEIEHVNVEALEELERIGKQIFPKPSVLRIIKDKGLQKKFYQLNGVATADFLLTEKAEDLIKMKDFLPAAHKLRTEGYDGKGVVIIKNESDIYKAFDKPAVLEKLVPLKCEIAIIVALDSNNNMVSFPPCEMVFNPLYNLVDYLISPASLSEEQTKAADDLARSVVAVFNAPGIYAIEMFLDENGEFLVNEIAPRAHNSGHNTIEGNFISQFHIQMRLMLQLPLGITDNKMPSLMYNLIGEDGYEGEVSYIGLEEVLQAGNSYVHLYGKTHTKPGRKMGHVTLLHPNKNELINLFNNVRNKIKVISK